MNDSMNPRSDTITAFWSGTCSICAPPPAESGVAISVQNGGYLRIAADQRWLQTVIRFRARHRPAEYLLVHGDVCNLACALRWSQHARPGSPRAGTPGVACAGTVKCRPGCAGWWGFAPPRCVPG